ncbi:MAG: hypothetical protein H0W72_10165 [Planctomycetes bacterium]|nr:hypothetical protein [Planctomycetota bacterium]
MASEPSIFWSGDGAAGIIAGIPVPSAVGRLEVAEPMFNGPSGRTLDSHYLVPLGLSRSAAWLCDLLPESRLNVNQCKAIAEHYLPWVARGILPAVDISAAKPPIELADEHRRHAIMDEITASGADILVTLGNPVLEQFVGPMGLGHSALRTFGCTPDAYGRLHPITVAGRAMRLLPLAHPRQAGALGKNSEWWGGLHATWMRDVAGRLL